MMLFLAALLATPVPLQSAQRDDAEMRSVMLSTHNREREAKGIAPLKWSDKLAADALAHAQWMARTGTFEPSTTRGNQGENLWMGRRDLYPYFVMSLSWIGEKRNYVHAPSPDNSGTGNSGDVSHYTQVIWSTTTEIGCGLASSATHDYFACRYSPPGNIPGRYAYDHVDMAQ